MVRLLRMRGIFATWLRWANSRTCLGLTNLIDQPGRTIGEVRRLAPQSNLHAASADCVPRRKHRCNPCLDEQHDPGIGPRRSILAGTVVRRCSSWSNFSHDDTQRERADPKDRPISRQTLLTAAQPMQPMASRRVYPGGQVQPAGINPAARWRIGCAAVNRRNYCSPPCYSGSRLAAPWGSDGSACFEAGIGIAWLSGSNGGEHSGGSPVSSSAGLPSARKRRNWARL